MSAQPRSSETPRTLLVSLGGEIGGAERSLLELACALPAKPLVAAPPDSPLSRELKRSGIATVPLSAPKLRRTINPLQIYRQTRALQLAATELAAACVAHGVQLLHANTDAAAILAWRAAKTAKLPYIWHCRDMTRSRAMIKILANTAVRVVAISAAVDDHLRECRVPPGKLIRIVNGIDLSRFNAGGDARTRLRRDLKLSAESVVLLSVGGFVPWKRHEDFLQLIACFRERGWPVAGWLAGSDLFQQNAAYEKKLRDKAAALKLPPESFRFLGQRDDIPELLAAADIVVSCSQNEPFGRSLAEAGAAGVPVLATDSGGKAEIVAAGVTGLLAPQGDIDALAAAAQRLVENAPLRATMGQAARERISAQFNIDRVARQIAALHSQVVSDA